MYISKYVTFNASRLRCSSLYFSTIIHFGSSGIEYFRSLLKPKKACYNKIDVK